MAHSSLPYETRNVPTEPSDIQMFLTGRGWTYQVGDGEYYYQHTSDQQHLYYTWSEAISYEMYRFMNLGS